MPTTTTTTTAVADMLQVAATATALITREATAIRPASVRVDFIDASQYEAGGLEIHVKAESIIPGLRFHVRARQTSSGDWAYGHVRRNC